MITAALYEIFLQHPSVQTDTRKLKRGDLFFALKGENFNGNQFARQALEEGAAYAIVDEDTELNERIIKTPDALFALQQLAKFHRDQFDIPFIAITGSNGKTTTKELVTAVLAAEYKTYATHGNLNNHIGVPLTLLQVKKDAQMAVIEMGANHQKEIESYCVYTEPTHGIITNCGKAHLEGFGGEDGVRKGKGELYDYLRAHSGSVFAFDDYDYLHSMSAGIKEVYWYGTQNGEITGMVKSALPFLEVIITKGASFRLLKTNLVGEYNLPNVLCAVAAGKYFQVPDEKIKASIENYFPSNSRSQLIKTGTNKIILDAYNANPSSMKAAIENFEKMPASKKVLLLGGMMELGESSIAEHENIFELVNKYTWNQVAFIGGDFKYTHHGYLFFNKVSEAKDWFEYSKFENTSILIKGSRFFQMEKILQ